MRDKTNLINKIKYIEYNNYLTKVLDKARLLYEKNIISSLGNNNKKVWDYVNSKIKNKNIRKSIDCVYDDDGEPITNKTEIAESFNTFFTNIGENLVSKIEKPEKHL